MYTCRLAGTMRHSSRRVPGEVQSCLRTPEASQRDQRDQKDQSSNWTDRKSQKNQKSLKSLINSSSQRDRGNRKCSETGRRNRTSRSRRSGWPGHPQCSWCCQRPEGRCPPLETTRVSGTTSRAVSSPDPMLPDPMPQTPYMYNVQCV